MRVEVLKSFRADGASLSRGDVVDAGEWPNLPRLISARYVRPVEGEVPSADVRTTTSRRGRKPQKG